MQQFRTFYPWMSLHSPTDFAEIVENYIDGWRKNGWIPEVALSRLLCQIKKLDCIFCSYSVAQTIYQDIPRAEVTVYRSLQTLL